VLGLYASPTGSGDGLTPATAASLTAARALARAAAGSDDVTVYLRGGTYQLAAPLTLDSGDSGANGFTHYWRAYPGETPSLSGGVPVTGWALFDGAKNIYSASVPAGAQSRQLYMNGQRATRARRTSTGFGTTNGGQTYVSTDATLPIFARPQDLEFVFTGLPRAWIEPRLSAASATRVGSTTTVTMDASYAEYVAHNPWGVGWPSAPTWVENALEFLDATTTGCWYLNASIDTIYYVPRPGEDMATVEAWLPQLEALVSSSAASPLSDVQFVGIVFEHAGWLGPSTLHSFMELQANAYLDPATAPAWTTPPAALSFQGAQRVRVSDCTVQHCGATAVSFGGGSSGCDFDWNTVTDISGRGVEIASDSISVWANLITGCGAEYRGAVGIWAGVVAHVAIHHNEITSVPYTAISLGWVWDDSVTASHSNEIAHNKIHDILKAGLYDGGGIYVLGYQGAYGGTETRVHDNYVYDMGTGLPWQAALYADQGCEAVLFNGNVCAAPDMSYWLGVNNDPDLDWIGGSGNYATAGKYISRGLSGVADATAITGTDPAAWPAAAQAVVAEAGRMATIPGALPGSVTLDATEYIEWTVDGAGGTFNLRLDAAGAGVLTVALDGVDQGTITTV
jgi:hypothetical protein